MLVEGSPVGLGDGVGVEQAVGSVGRQGPRLAADAAALYIGAARQLSVPPAHWVVFEDANVGLTAAHASGTMAIMVPDILPPLPEARTKCVEVVDDLHAALRLLEAVL